MKKKIKKLDFMTIVGFFGHTAIVDKKIQSKIKRLNVQQLLDSGYYKEAVRAVIYDDQEEERQLALEYLRQFSYIESFEMLVREFGVQTDTLIKIEKIKKV